MTWLAVMTLNDGSRVESESNLPTVEGITAGVPGSLYRLRLPDSTLNGFPTLRSLLEYLGSHYDLDNLRYAAVEEICSQSRNIRTGPTIAPDDRVRGRQVSDAELG